MMQSDLPASSSKSENLPASSSSRSVSNLLQGMLSDSSSSTRPHDIRMPWEEGVFAEIFGKDEIFSLPKVLSAGFPSHLQEAPSLELATEATARVENHRVVYHDVALAMHSKRKLESFDDKMALLSQRFELLLAHEYSGSSLGRLGGNLSIRCVKGFPLQPNMWHGVVNKVRVPFRLMQMW